MSIFFVFRVSRNSLTFRKFVNVFLTAYSFEQVLLKNEHSEIRKEKRVKFVFIRNAIYLLIFFLNLFKPQKSQMKSKTRIMISIERNKCLIFDLVNF